MPANKIAAVVIALAALAVTFAGRLPDLNLPTDHDEVSVAAQVWESDVRVVYADAAKQEFTTDRAAFDWLKSRMEAVNKHATEGIREAEAAAAKDGWSLDKARKNWQRWGR